MRMHLHFSHTQRSEDDLMKNSLHLRLVYRGGGAICLSVPRDQFLHNLTMFGTSLIDSCNQLAIGTQRNIVLLTSVLGEHYPRSQNFLNRKWKQPVETRIQSLSENTKERWTVLQPPLQPGNWLGLEVRDVNTCEHNSWVTRLSIINPFQHPAGYVVVIFSCGTVKIGLTVPLTTVKEVASG